MCEHEGVIGVSKESTFSSIRDPVRHGAILAACLRLADLAAQRSLSHSPGRQGTVHHRLGTVPRKVGSLTARRRSCLL